MAKDTSEHDGDQPNWHISQSRERLEELFGETLDNYLLDDQERRNLFGEWVRRIRESKARPADYIGRQRTMSQAALATRCTLVWWEMFHEQRAWDARWVRKLEAGEVELSQALVACLVVALGATDYEAAILLELAGYNGWLALVASRLGAHSTLLPDLQDHSLPYDPKERASLLELRIRVVIREVYRRLQALPDLQ